MDREIEKLRKEKETAKAKNRWRDAAETCNYIGHRLSQLHRYEEALEEHREEFKICQTRLGDTLGAAVAYRNMGECYSLMGDHFKALKYQQGYLKLAQELNNVVEMQRAQTTIGRAYLMFIQSTKDRKLDAQEEALRSKAPAKAEMAFLEALQLSQRCKGQVQEKEYNQMRCRAYLNLGHLYDELGELEKCAEKFGLAIRTSRKFDLKEDLYLCQIGLALHYENQGRMKEASRLYDEAFLSAKVMKNKVHMHDALLAKASLLLKLGDFVGARRAFKKAFYVKSPIKEEHEKACKFVKLATLLVRVYPDVGESQDPKEKMKALEKVADILAELNCYSLAINFYKQELELAKEIDDLPTSDLATILASLAQTYADDGKHREALEHFLEELECRTGQGREESATLLQVARMKDELGYPEDDIIATYEKALEKAGEHSTSKWIALDHFNNYLSSKQSHFILKERIKKEFKRLNDIFESTGEEPDSQEESTSLEDEIDLDDISGLSSDEEEAGPKAPSTAGRRPRQPRKNKEFKLNEVGETPLHRACIEGNLTAVKKLIERGHPIDIRDYCGWLPLHEAVNHGQLEIVEYLIEKGTNINDRGGPFCEGVTPLHDAASNGHISIMRLLIEKGAKVNALTDRKESILDCFRGWLNRVKCELDEDEMREARDMEKDLEKLLKNARFDVGAPTSSPLNTRRAHKRALSPDALDERCAKSPSPGPALFRMENEDEIDFDNPDVARKEYVSAVQSMRRQQGINRRSLPFVGSKRALSSSKNTVNSLLEERQRVTDDWLVDDIGDSRPSKKTQENPFEVGASRGFAPRRMRLADMVDINEEDRSPPRKTKSQPNRRKNNRSDDIIVDDENSDSEPMRAVSPPSHSDREFMDTDYNDDSYRAPTPPPFSPPPNDIDTENAKKVSRGSSAPQGPSFPLRGSDTDLQRDSDIDSLKSSSTVKTSASSSSKFSVRVIIEGLTLLVTVPSKMTPVSWLINEVAQRYSKVVDCRPLISLYTLDDALLSSDDLISDAVAEGKALAKIEGWDLPDLNKRYEELCVQTHLIPNEDVVNLLKSAEICGRLVIKNACIPSNHIQLLHKSLLKKNVIEIDFSGSNALFEDLSDNFLAVLPTLKRLKRLLLKNCGLNNAYVAQLLFKISELSISFLDLSYNNLSDEILDVLKQELERHPSSIKIDMTGCDLGAEKAGNIVEFRENLQLQTTTTNDSLIKKLTNLAPLYDDFNE